MQKANQTASLREFGLERSSTLRIVGTEDEFIRMENRDDGIINKILCGDTLTLLRTFPDECVDSVVTSPPYYGLRDYGVKGQLGLEKTLDEYIEKMLLITAELKRVLKKTGTLWWNHGDCYSASRWTGSSKGQPINKFRDGHRDINPQKGIGLDDKTLVMQNYRLVKDMVYQQGWLLRNIIIWHKPNCMPSSVKDRFTVDYEPIFFLTKSKKYWFEQQYEEQIKTEDKDRLSGHRGWNNDITLSRGAGEGSIIKFNPLGRNKRCVWKISIKPCREAHFATFPPELIETPVKAGCPEMICRKCGEPRRKIYVGTSPDGFNIRVRDVKEGRIKYAHRKASQKEIDNYEEEKTLARSGKKFAGLTDCGCDAGFEGGIVLDPFVGSGTTAAVASRLARRYIGIDLNPEYVKMARNRLKSQMLPKPSLIK